LSGSPACTHSSGVVVIIMYAATSTDNGDADAARAGAAVALTMLAGGGGGVASDSGSAARGDGGVGVGLGGGGGDGSCSIGRWSEQEHGRFLQGVEAHGHAWRDVQRVVGSRTTVQVWCVRFRCDERACGMCATALARDSLPVTPARFAAASLPICGARCAASCRLASSHRCLPPPVVSLGRVAIMVSPGDVSPQVLCLYFLTRSMLAGARAGTEVPCSSTYGRRGRCTPRGRPSRLELLASGGAADSVAAASATPAPACGHRLAERIA
jgi:hypothetical protein